ncbi:MAG TPA: 16S rRNA (uracil(1498)-N(3))-methyltransferase [Pyrinomonadaceae bacterium]|nr:16S rRNA (uracil(1498)-N(3))-methyltransferase [Pyrinomonadaceae bacterium]
MTRRRFHSPPDSFNTTEQTVTLGTDEARHLRDVLRLKAGDEVYVFDGLGREFRCVITTSKRDAAELRIEAEVEPAKPESQLQLNLCVALLKGEKFDLVVQKATELGVKKITPLITRYADIHLRDAADATKRVARWQRIALEAAKQSGRAFVPEIRVPHRFEEVLDVDGLGVMFAERGGEALENLKESDATHSITALIGSEGGWSDEEIESARARNFHVVTLGGRILRAETAAITVTALLQHLFGDLK